MASKKKKVKSDKKVRTERFGDHGMEHIEVYDKNGKPLKKNS